MDQLKWYSRASYSNCILRVVIYGPLSSYYGLVQMVTTAVFDYEFGTKGLAPLVPV